MDETTLDLAVRSYAAHERHTLGVHPDVEDLVAYQSGELPEPARGEIQEHLSFCDECTHLVLDLASFSDLEHPEGFEVTEEDLAAGREALLAQLPTADDSRVVAFPVPVRPVAVYRALAAVLGAAVLGLSLWVATLKRTVETLSAPRSNVAVHDLVPADDSTVRGTEPAVVAVPATASEILLILSLYDLRPFPSYRVEILRDDGALMWSDDSLRRTADDNFTLRLPRGFLAEATYQIRVHGIEGDAASEIATYSVRILHE